MDGFLRIAYDEFEPIRKEIDEIELNSTDLHLPRYTFNNPINYKEFKRIITNNNFLSLTWRIDYDIKVNNKLTYYGALLDYHNNKFNCVK